MSLGIRIIIVFTIVGFWSSRLESVLFRRVHRAVTISTGKNEPGILAMQFWQDLETKIKDKNLKKLVEHKTPPDMFHLSGRMMGYRTLKTNPLVIDTSELGLRLRLGGNLELLGMGFGPNRYIHVKWTDAKGVDTREGLVDVEKGRYQIEIPSWSGTISAQMVDSEGRVLGKTESSLNDLPRDSEEVGKAHELPLKILKKENEEKAILAEIESHTESYASLGRPGVLSAPNSFAAAASSPVERERPRKPASKVQLAEANIEEDPSANPSVVTYPFEYPKKTVSTFIEALPADSFVNTTNDIMVSVGLGSTYLLAAHGLKEEDPITYQMITVGMPTRVPLFRKTTIDAMDNLVRMSGEHIAEVPLVWGLVDYKQEASSGISVQVEGHEEARVFYLNDIYLPDPNLKQTKSHGRFVIANLEPGFYILTATTSNGVFATRHFVVADSGVTHVSVGKGSEDRVVPTYAFDAFSGTPQAVNAEFESSSHRIRIRVEDQIVVSGRLERKMVQLDPATPYYAPTTHIYRDDVEKLDLPMLRWDWISKYYKREAGSVVGFVRESNYEVQVRNIFEVRAVHKPSYFDFQGDESSSSQPGGGFVFGMLKPGTYILEMRRGGTGELLVTHIVDVKAGEIVSLGADLLEASR